MKMKQTMKTIALAIVVIVTAWGGHIYAKPPTAIPDRGGSYTNDRGDNTCRCAEDSTDSRHSLRSVNPYGIAVGRITENTPDQCIVGSTTCLSSINHRCQRSRNIWNIPYLPGLHKPIKENHVEFGASWTYYCPGVGLHCYITSIYTVECRGCYVYATETKRGQRHVGRLERRGIRHLTHRKEVRNG